MDARVESTPEGRRLSGAEQALSASQRDLRLTIDTIPALVWSTNADGSVDFVNQHYLDYVGLASEQLMDWDWTTAIHSDDLSGLTTIWRSLIASGKSGGGGAVSSGRRRISLASGTRQPLAWWQRKHR
jgi:PAS domain S-box-containing protein